MVEELGADGYGRCEMLCDKERNPSVTVVYQ